MATMADEEYTSVKDFYRGRSIFITGGTGFMGKVLVEKLLRSCQGIKNIYLLIRPKKDKNVQKRLEEILNTLLFDKLRRDSPHELTKIVPIAGDLTKPELGISAPDQETLTRHVSVVFHSAATVKFDESLKFSIMINMIGSEQLIHFCHRMVNLEALIHVSTAYCNCDRTDVSELIYPPPQDPEQVIACTRLLNDKLIEELTPKLIDSRPNTYTFTKALAETMFQGKSGSLPSAIVRPSIVVSSLREPVAGWVDNLNGPTRLVAAIGKGLFRTMLCYENKVADLVPVDIVINLMICVAWKTATHRIDTITVYNCCTGQQNPINWKQFLELIVKYSRIHPSNEAVRFPGIHRHRYSVINNISGIFQHIIPAHILDFIARLKGSRPIMLRAQAKFCKAASAFEYFTTQQWNFRDDNVRKLGQQLDAEDSQTFMFDVKQIDWPSYVENYILGIRHFISNESPDTLPAARARMMKLYWIQKIILFGTILIIFRVILFCISLA